MPSALFETLLLNAASSSSSTRARIPAFLYGCAWKKDRTADLVYRALCTGFRGVDVAAQPRHYREELAGEGIRRAISEGKVKRDELFVQTKFTSVDGQDPDNMPYDARSSVTEQVKASIASSLKNLRAADGDSAEDTYIDSLVLHSPLRTIEATEEAWAACEEFVPTGQIRALGISNTSLPVLEHLWSTSNIKPAVVQNRFYRDTDYDIPLRRFCREHDIVYQSFWTLSANPRLMRHPSVELLAKSADISKEVALYALVMALEGTVVLNGTKNHMEEDLEGLEKVKAWAGSVDKWEWEDLVKHFKDATGDNNPGQMPEEMVGFSTRKPASKLRDL